MLVPLSWLEEYVDITIPAKELAAKLTASGTSVERIQAIGEGLDDLIVAEVLEVKPHPNADRLRLATVNTGQEKLQIVCGAPNLAAGQKVVFAPVGARVPVNMHDEERQPFTLTQATIRGVDSQGMICSSAEMGLGDEHAGILVLPDEAKVGQKVSKTLGYPQIVFDTEVTTNRNDELSMIGIAREVAVLTDKKLRLPIVKESKNPRTQGPKLELKVKIESKACTRLMAQAFSVKVGPSPEWLQQRLSMYGMRPINNVVDITNYVMLEYGQPLHGYDVSKLHGQALSARQAKAGETMVTLDGTERQLKADMLVIADDKAPVGIAGIMGGEASKTDEQTTAIVLEAAVFDPVVIRKTANALALRSEASKRFERGVDATTTPTALQRAGQLLVELADARPLSQVVDAYPNPQKANQYILSQQKLNQYLGKEFALPKAKKILQALGFALVKESPEAITVSVPSWRASDIDGQEDLIEEVVRMVGYSSLPVELPSGTIPNQLINRHYANRWLIKQLLSQLGWSEILTNSLTDTASDGASNGVAIENPLSSEWTHMRQQLLPGLLATAKSNIRQRPNLKLFELSQVYLPTNKDRLPDERYHLGLLLAGGLSVEDNFILTKSIIEEILLMLGVKTIKYSQGSPRLLYDGKDAAIVTIENDEKLGWIDQLTISHAQKFDVPKSTIVAEIDLEELLDNTIIRKFSPLPKFPSVEEDMSLIMEESGEIGPLVQKLKKSSNLVETISVSSVYRSPSLGENVKSILLHVTYRANNRTLAANEINDLRILLTNTILANGATIRE